MKLLELWRTAWHHLLALAPRDVDAFSWWSAAAAHAAAAWAIALQVANGIAERQKLKRLELVARALDERVGRRRLRVRPARGASARARHPGAMRLVEL